MSPEISFHWYSAFIAGFVTSLSPCVYPMIPISVGYLSKISAKSLRQSVLAFALGQAATLTVLGLIAARLGETFGFSSDARWVNITLAVILFGLGYFSLRGANWEFVGTFNTKIEKWTSKSGLFGAFIFGAASALVASPCTSPALGVVLTQVAANPDSIRAIISMFSFSAGLSFVFLIFGFGFNKVSKLPRLGIWTERVHRLMTVGIFAASFYYLYRGFV